ncbi:DUF952 domain-containing protein [Streptoalloteichus hindustanus]|uniref:Uncharacterized conserved protein, DUF952 family n=1 Tax=Streptoalloteichus hindustanus TaxID=2017 RepID=A0A1M4VCF3_STRHI|nr:DUF952 domain-containing protein [Streptoalloteichus hindustanus]SHE66636.1 Uncharacterized conserved protein, DUF952 family [Streptoalloteichus hindustanus]
MILHICARAEWDSARAVGEHVPAGFAVDGFVHCSDPGTVHLPANALFRGRDDLVLLEIDPAGLGVELRWEPGDPGNPAGPWFPHVYGPIPTAAVVAVHDFPPSPDGTFRLPDALARR